MKMSFEDEMITAKWTTDNVKKIFKVYKIYRRWFCTPPYLYRCAKFQEFIDAFGTLPELTSDVLIGRVEYEEMKEAYDDPEFRSIYSNPRFIEDDKRKSDWYVEHYRNLANESLKKEYDNPEFYSSVERHERQRKRYAEYYRILETKKQGDIDEY